MGSTSNHCNCSAKKARTTSNRADQRAPCNHNDGRAGQIPVAHSFFLGGPYTRQNAQASIITADANRYGRAGCHRAIAIEPDTPNSATAHGPMQHSPMNDAIALIPIAPPDVAASFLSSRISAPINIRPHTAPADTWSCRTSKKRSNHQAPDAGAYDRTCSRKKTDMHWSALSLSLYARKPDT